MSTPWWAEYFIWKSVLAAPGGKARAHAQGLPPPSGDCSLSPFAASRRPSSEGQAALGWGGPGAPRLRPRTRGSEKALGRAAAKEDRTSPPYKEERADRQAAQKREERAAREAAVTGRREGWSLGGVGLQTAQTLDGEDRGPGCHLTM